MIRSIMFLLLIPVLCFAQEKKLKKSKKEKNWTLSGYVTNMQSATFEKLNGLWINDNLIHNRLNFKWYANDNITMSIEARNRFISGESVKFIPNYSKMINVENGLIDLSDNLLNEKSFIFNSAIDRAWLDYNKNDFQIRVGRQRINWGQCYVWNPNDIFNSYSFFDFDYFEKPGSDAIRIQYYPSMTSAIEIAVKSNYNRKITAAALYRFNKWGYDIQFLGGIMNEKDLITGIGFSGNIKNLGVRGELSYFHDKDSLDNSSGILSATLGLEYTMKNSVFLQAEVLYNGNAKNNSINSFGDFYNMNLSAKSLSFTELSVFTQATYPITPLVNASISFMYYPGIDGVYAGPTVDVSLGENLVFSVICQMFSGKMSNKNEKFYLSFLRLKYSF